VRVLAVHPSQTIQELFEMRHQILRSTLVTGVLVVVAACASRPPMDNGSMQMSSAAPITDANIAAVVVAANNADISYAQVAMSKSQNDKVRGFAQTMINDHGGVNKAAVELVTRLGVTPMDNEMSREIRDNASQKVARWGMLSGMAFDSTYIASEIEYHKMVISAMDATLIPGATNAELKSTLVSVRPAFVAHLALAEQIKSSMAH